MNLMPSYIELLRNGELFKRAEKAYSNLTICTSCPRDCKVNRIDNELGICTSGYLPIVSQNILEKNPFYPELTAQEIFFLATAI